MGKTALEIIEAETEWMQKRIFYGTMAHLSENLDSFPMSGMGLGFMKRSAEKILEERMEAELLPVLEKHVQTQLEFTRALAETGAKDAVVEEYRDKLLETDPLWDVLKADESREDAKEDILDANVEACTRAARWMEEAGEQEFEDYRDFMAFLGKSSDEAVEELERILYYVELMDRYRDHIDVSGYSTLLDREKAHEWFVENFLAGLKMSEKEVLDEVRSELQ